MKLICCQRKNTTMRHKIGFKQGEVSKTQSSNPISENDIEMAMNTDRQEKQQLASSKHTSDQQKQSTDTSVKSFNLYSELNFEQLQFQYKTVFKNIIEAHQRFQLYYRIANINKGSQLGKVFKFKHEQIEAYIESLFNSKKMIEDQIQYYIEYVSENLNIKENFVIQDNVDEEFEEQIDMDSIEIEDIDSPKNQVTGAMS